MSNEQHLNIVNKVYHQMYLSKSKCWYSNNCLHFLKFAVPLYTNYQSLQLFMLEFLYSGVYLKESLVLTRPYPQTIQHSETSYQGKTFQLIGM
jgi:hypothetical protein